MIEAQNVLIDFLTSMLTKPQSFLREVANQCFKQYALCVDEQGLARLLGIVATPNQEAGAFMDGDDQGDGDQDEEEGEEVEHEQVSSEDDTD